MTWASQPAVRKCAGRCLSVLAAAAFIVVAGIGPVAVSAADEPGAQAGAATAKPDPFYDPVTGYRTEHYRAATPSDVPGGTKIELEEIDRLTTKIADPAARAILVDVMPSTGAGYDPASGEWRLTKRHGHIPGSTWLPDVGRGQISAELDSYFRSNLAQLTGGDFDKPMIIYCQSDCWMGWNAVQRAAGYGYTKIYWYPDGIDGWRDWDRDFEPAEPVPVGVTQKSDFKDGPKCRALRERGPVSSQVQ